MAVTVAERATPGTVTVRPPKTSFIPVFRYWPAAYRQVTWCVISAANSGGATSGIGAAAPGRYAAV